VVAQRAVARGGLPALTAVGLRYAIAAALLLVVLAARGRPVLPAPGERLRAFALGAVGYAVQAVLFYSALRYGAAGTVALLFYVYPAIVLCLEAVTGRLRAGPGLAVAVVLACAGAGVVVSAGEAAYVTRTGAALALASALCIAVYLVVNSRLLPRSGAAAAAAWVSLGTAASTLTLSVGGGLPSVTAAEWGWLAVAGATTGVATALMYAALARVAASRVAVLLALQTLVVLGLAHLLLGEPVGTVQLAGCAAVIGAAALSARSRERA
jgi:drug/metabolite transporter (DMT)-like permease